MHEKVKATVAELEKKIAKVKLTEEDLLLVEELMPTANIWLDHDVNVDWAAGSMEEVKGVLAAFAKRGVMLDEFCASDSTPHWYLRGKNVRIRLFPCWSKEEGAMCRLVQVGEVTNTYPKYKLVCDKTEEHG